MKRCCLVLAWLCAVSLAVPSARADADNLRNLDNLNGLTCTRLAQIMQNTPDEAGMLFLWLSGWWSGVHDSPEYGGKRANGIAQVYMATCPNGTGEARLFDALRKKTPPPDNYNTQNQNGERHLADGPENRYYFAYWLAGWQAARAGGPLSMNHEAIRQLGENFAVQCIERADDKLSEIIRSKK